MESQLIEARVQIPHYRWLSMPECLISHRFLHRSIQCMVNLLILQLSKMKLFTSIQSEVSPYFVAVCRCQKMKLFISIQMRYLHVFWPFASVKIEAFLSLNHTYSPIL
ncbi:hypothetical protein ACN38_g10701 [Penicillium nordicum]|uniref:Uncharacterized protein n=1 Tax=Penicillium nordicum TaxID=229535 RepID=A0A0M9WBK6_9EURO|nr:hypothetical protein ACN38_g10701 [Penicillium nordicum]